MSVFYLRNCFSFFLSLFLPCGKAKCFYSRVWFHNSLSLFYPNASFSPHPYRSLFISIIIISHISFLILFYLSLYDWLIERLYHSYYYSTTCHTLCTIILQLSITPTNVSSPGCIGSKAGGWPGVGRQSAADAIRRPDVYSRVNERRASSYCNLLFPNPHDIVWCEVSTIENYRAESSDYT